MGDTTHVLVVEGDARYSIECPHPASHPSCAYWEPCGCDVPRVPPKDGEEPEDAETAEEAWGSPCPANPGLTHRYDPEYVGEMTAPTGDCWPAEVAGDIEGADIGWPEPGRYVIEWRCEDGCYLDIIEMTPVTASQADKRPHPDVMGTTAHSTAVPPDLTASAPDRAADVASQQDTAS